MLASVHKGFLEILITANFKVDGRINLVLKKNNAVVTEH